MTDYTIEGALVMGDAPTATMAELAIFDDWRLYVALLSRAAGDMPEYKKLSMIASDVSAAEQCARTWATIEGWTYLNVEQVEIGEADAVV